LYCATYGGAGQSSGIPVSSVEELSALRRDELLAACRILGIGTVVHGGHPDGALAATDPELVLGDIVGLLRRERPQVVLTFGPEGAPTTHRDHRALSRLATAATLLAGTTTAFPDQLVEGVTPHRAARLLYVTWPTPLPGALYQTEGQPTDVRIDVRQWRTKKREAFLAHRTQRQHQAGFEASAMPDSEDYFLVHGVPYPKGSTDLFAGLG
jgi:LmbE family N-acetylglucosaminyl deacetylase